MSRVPREGAAKPEPRHVHVPGDRLAWSEGPGREAGEGVVIELLPPTKADRQLRYRLATFRDGRQSDESIVLPQGLVYPVPRWERDMGREERLEHHRGSTLPWNEPIPDT